MGKPTETADLSQRELTDSRLTTGEPAEETELGPLNVGGSCVVWAVGGVTGSGTRIFQGIGGLKKGFLNSYGASPRNTSLDQAGIELTEILLPLFPKLGLKACATTARLYPYCK